MEAKSALKGVKVLEIGRAIAGPWTCQYLAQYGAQVIKVENKKHPDVFRVTSPYKDNIPDPDRCYAFLPFNSNKYSITLDLANPRGIEVAHRLVRWSDIVVENFSKGVIDRMGLGYTQLKELKPDIIMASSSITGRTGPWSEFTGWGHNGAAMSGIYHVTGYPDGEPVQPVSQSYTDFVTALFTVIALVAALEYRHMTGKGQYIDISHMETGIHFIAPAIMDYAANRRNQTRQGNRHPTAAPHGVFRCKGDDSWCTIAVFTDEEWDGFCRATDNPEWTKDTKFTTSQSRKENEDELERLVEEWTIRYSSQEVMGKMQATGVASGIVKDTRNIMTDPNLKKSQSFTQLKHPVVGLCYHMAMPPGLSKTPRELRPAPCLGEHNYHVCTQFLGMSDTEFVELAQARVFE